MKKYKCKIINKALASKIPYHHKNKYITDQWDLFWKCKNSSTLAYPFGYLNPKVGNIPSNLMSKYLVAFPLVPARDGLMAMHSVQSHRYSCLKEPTLGLTLCCSHLKFLIFSQVVPHLVQADLDLDPSSVTHYLPDLGQAT